MHIHRRNFIKAGFLTTANLAFFRVAGNTLWMQAPAVPGMQALRNGFAQPPMHTRSSCYWWWFNNLVNKKSITRDLEEFKAKGMGAVLLVCSASGLGGVKPIPQGPAFLSAGWLDLFRHALQEAHRLGIEVGFNLCAGWAMGGPWIKPEHSGRWLLQSRLTLTGPQHFNEALPLPGNRDGYDHVFNPPGYKAYIDLPLEQLDYRDTSVVAIPVPDEDHAKLDTARLALLPAKTNRLDASNFTRAKVVMAPTLTPWEALPTDTPIPVTDIIDLTARLTADGRLDWEVPPGKWVIIRTGHRMTGSKTMLALPGTEGLSVDWLDSKGVDDQFEHIGKILLAEAGPLAGKTLKYFCDDSFEDGFPNWTSAILERFKTYRGYDATPYLPVFSGYLTGSAAIADRFLYDYRKTVANCMADEHYRYFADLCHQHGLLVQNEAAGPSRSGTMCMDGLKNLGRSDMPMGEFWLGPKHDEPGGLDDKLPYGVSRLEDGQNKVCKMVASAAHIYGKPTASAEAFTSFRPHWVDYPGILKPAADRAFCEGINRIFIHTSTATRIEDGLPGYEYGAGTHFNPNVTWWNKASGFLDYIGRCQYLLQQGLFVADVLYYNGDWAPNLVEAKHTDPSLGKGYDYDVCNAEVLLQRLSVKNGRLLLPDGMSYRVLVLPDTRKMPLEVMHKIRELVKAGATVIGPKPEQDPGLRNYPACDNEVRIAANEVWGACDGVNVKHNQYGRGHVYWGIAVHEVLQEHGVHQDFFYAHDDAFIDFIHRSTSAAEIYFVVNRKNQPATLPLAFRVTGQPAEIWDPVSATSRPAQVDDPLKDHTVMLLAFEPYQSFFIIFPNVKSLKPSPGHARKIDVPTFKPLQTIQGPWQVKFDPRWGGPAAITFDELQDWSQRPETGIKYYSGTATYIKHFDLDPGSKGAAALFLHLGAVKNIAQVKLNGRDLGIVWTAPWWVDITKAVKPSGNILEIEVVNCWPNRLIGDAALPPAQRLTNTNVEFKKDMPLLPSGLLGPVTIQVQHQVL